MRVRPRGGKPRNYIRQSFAKDPYQEVGPATRRTRTPPRGRTRFRKYHSIFLHISVEWIMTSFKVSIPFAGEAVSVFKSVTDLFSYGDFGNEKVTIVSDDTTSFTFPVTFGVFRLLLDGNCIVADRDFDSHVSLMSVTSRDRGGKGKMDARIRLFLDETIDSSNVICECDVTTKGMLARVSLPIEDVMSTKIETALKKVIEESGNAVRIDGLASAVMSMDSEVSPIVIAAEPIESDAKPFWVVVLQFPATMLSYPITVIRSMCREIFSR